MRHLLLILSLSIVFIYEGSAQNPALKNGVFANRIFIDAQTTNGGSFFNHQAYRPAWEIGYVRNVLKNVNVAIPIRAGVYSASSDEANNIPYYSVDLQGQYYFYKENRRIVPYLAAGIGFIKDYESDLNVQVPLGVGLFVKIFDGAHFNINTSYRVGFSKEKSSLQHGIGFVYALRKLEKKQDMPEDMATVEDNDGDGVPDNLDLCPAVHGLEKFNGCPDSDGDDVEDAKDKCPEFAGLVEFDGCPDSDNDGVPDNLDQCPNMAGSKTNNGCPVDEAKMDDDNDGVPNESDKCPNIAGSKATMGCPDSDGDGVEDSSDKCPNIAGALSALGCPDSDGDGVEDSKDKCPNIRGNAIHDGCPESMDSDNDGIQDDRDECPNIAGLLQFNGCPDSDGDGVEDSKDNCPNSYGVKENGGCPEIKKQDRETLDIAMRAVQFNTGKSTLKDASFIYLDQIAKILRNYPDYNLIIGGHTDDVGSAVLNQRLSERRAKSCYEYIVTRGISAKRLRYAGYGESRPIAENLTQSGRALNRRVEFKLIPPRR